jgi:hypothetical protein
MVYGGSYYSRTTNVKPADSAVASFVVVKFNAHDCNNFSPQTCPENLLQKQCSRSRKDQCDPDTKQFAVSPMQVSMCKDGTVSGKSSMTQTGDCSNGPGGVQYAAVDALIRDSLALARYELAQRRMLSTNDFCQNNEKWDAMRCMNSLTSDSQTNWSGFTQCHYVHILEASQNFNLLEFFSDGDASAPFEPSNGRTDWTEPGPSHCTDGQTYSGKCTVKVCHNRLRVWKKDPPCPQEYVHNMKFKLRWVHGTTTHERVVINALGAIAEWKWDGSDGACGSGAEPPLDTYTKECSPSGNMCVCPLHQEVRDVSECL